MTSPTCTPDEIRAYWMQRINESDMGCDWSDALERCWRCSRQGTVDKALQRCHIVPRSIGGEDVPSNYVMLCRWCHDQAPNVPDASFMWQWIRETHATFYDQHLGNHVLAIFRLLEIDLLAVDWMKFFELLRQCGRHFPQENGFAMTEGTIEWCIRNAGTKQQTLEEAIAALQQIQHQSEALAP